MASLNSHVDNLLKIEDSPQAITGYCKRSQILPSNTKTRRLGYLRMILDLFESSDYYPISYFPQKIEQEVEPQNDYLSKYRNDKGLITKSKKTGAFTGSSAKPYLELAENLSLLIEINKTYILTKQSKIYRVINRQIKNGQLSKHFNGIGQALPSDENPFILNLFQKSFLLHQILVKDPLYFWALLEIINSQQGDSIETLKKSFKQQILDELHRQLESTHLPTFDKQQILQIQQRIRNWQKPDKYLPHIIEPRVNWLLDLDFLDIEAFQNQKLILSDVGIRMFENLMQFYRYFQEKSTIIEFIIEHYFFQLINKIYNIGLHKSPENSSEYLIPYIEESFKHFKTMAPKSISAYQAIYYSCYKIFLKSEHIIEFIDIKKFLENKQNTKFTLDWYPKEHDGSLQKRR